MIKLPYPVLLTPLYADSISAGFPSPASDYLEARLDLNAHLIQSPSSTYFVRAEGDSMRGRGIFSGDLLVVDRSITPKSGQIVIAALDGELTCKILDTERRCLVAANPRYPSIPITQESAFSIEGVVIASVRYHQCSP
ncbi:MAG: DNA polymerase V [Motiliproteus sp.]|jgi:DNA polymerase V